MKLFIDISRLLPAALIITLAMVAQSLAMVLADNTDHRISEQHIGFVICSDGELVKVVFDQDGGSPEPSSHNVHCPFCILGKAMVLPENASNHFLVRKIGFIHFSKETAFSQVRDVRPDALHCLDPPSA